MQTHIIIVGGGFGGLSAAKHLERNKQVKITLIDKNNYHLFQPFLYQVATCELSACDIATSLRAQFKESKNVSILMDNVIKIETEKKQIHTKSGLTLSYTYLIIATGSKNNFFGHEGWQAHTYGLKNLKDAVCIRNAWLKLFEKMEIKTRLEKGVPQINCAIIGGGATGVEAAGSMLEFIKHCVERNFSYIKKQNIHLFLIEAGPRLIPSFTQNAALYTEKTLRSLGAIILLNTKVDSIHPGKIILSTGDTLDTDMIIWAAGVEASPIKDAFVEKIETAKGGKIKVNGDLSLPFYPETFVIGDVSEALDNAGNPLPGLAAVATQQGKFVAQVISRRIKGIHKKERFHYNNLGNLAIISRYHGIAEIYTFKFYGLIGWALWDAVHIYFLIELRDRIIVFIKWLWIYFTRYKNEQIIAEQDN